MRDRVLGMVEAALINASLVVTSRIYFRYNAFVYNVMSCELV